MKTKAFPVFLILVTTLAMNNPAPWGGELDPQRLNITAPAHTSGLSASDSARNSLPAYDNQLIMPETWEEVDFVYYDNFLYKAAYSGQIIKGCQQATSHQGKSVLRCTEHINLLRPKTLVWKWQQKQQQQGWVPITIKEFGINGVHGHITAIKPTTVDTTGMDLKTSRSSPVIGIFERHTLNVRIYTFKDVNTGAISTLNATPNHPFYVADKQIFEPIQTIGPDDQLVNAAGHQVRLLCEGNKADHCGINYKNTGVPVVVYNLEVYRQHRYFVGKEQILVHNAYQCPACGKQFSSTETIQTHWSESHPEEQAFSSEAIQALNKLSTSFNVSYDSSPWVQIELKGGDSTLLRSRFYPDKWIIRAIYREDKSVPFHANDFLRYAYLRSADISKLNIRWPETIEVELIDNPEAMGLFEFKSANREEIEQYYLSRPGLGKFMSRVLQDFNFKINSAHYNAKLRTATINIIGAQ